jgi:hypothetical protein
MLGVEDMDDAVLDLVREALGDEPGGASSDS